MSDESEIVMTDGFVRTWHGSRITDVPNDAVPGWECESCGKDYGSSRAAADACCLERDRRWMSPDDWG